MTDKSFSDRLPRLALEVRTNSGKFSKEDCKRLANRFNGFRLAKKVQKEVLRERSPSQDLLPTLDR